MVCPGAQFGHTEIKLKKTASKACSTKMKPDLNL